MGRPKKITINPDWVRRIYALIPAGKTDPQSNLTKVIESYQVSTQTYIDHTLTYILGRIRPDIAARLNIFSPKLIDIWTAQ